MNNKLPQTSDPSLTPPGLWTTKRHIRQTLLTHHQACGQQNTDVRHFSSTARPVDNKTPQTSDTALPPPGLWTTKHRRRQRPLSHRQACGQKKKPTADVVRPGFDGNVITPRSIISRCNNYEHFFTARFSSEVSVWLSTNGGKGREKYQYIFIQERFHLTHAAAPLPPPLPSPSDADKLAVLPVRLSCRVTLITSCQSC